jgi:hypothetical protein
MAAPKANPTTVEKEILSSAMTFNKAAIALQDAVKSAENLEERVHIAEEQYNKKAGEYAALITEKTAEIQGLEAQFSEKERIGKLDVDLKLRQYGVTAATQMLGSDYAVLPRATYDELQKKVQEAESTTKKEIAVAVSSVKSEYELKLKEQSLTAQTASAKDKAELESMKTQIAYYERTIASLNQMIEAERQASIERAKAGAIGTLNLSPTK